MTNEKEIKDNETSMRRGAAATGIGIAVAFIVAPVLGQFTGAVAILAGCASSFMMRRRQQNKELNKDVPKMPRREKDVVTGLRGARGDFRNEAYFNRNRKG